MKNIHRILFLFALSNIVKCEVTDWTNTDQSGNIWSNGQNGNIWSSSGNSGQNGNIWSSPGNSEQTGNIWGNSGNNGQHGNIWGNSGNNGQSGSISGNLGNKGQKGNNGSPVYDYASKYQDNNVNFGYKVQNGNADVWFSSLLDHIPWGNNYNMTGTQQANNNGWNQVQSSWNNQQASQPQPYFYPKPPQTLTTPEPNIPTSTEQPESSTSAAAPLQNNGNYYIPNTNFYQNQIELSNDFLKAIQQIPVIDLTQVQNSIPQSEPPVMMNNTQENLPQKELPVTAQPIAATPQPISDPNIKQNLVQMPMQQQLVQPPQFIPKPESLIQQNSVAPAQNPNLNNQKNHVNIPQQFAPWQYPQNTQIRGNYPVAPQNPSPNNLPGKNVNQEQFNMPANVQSNIVSPFLELRSPFNSNQHNGNFHLNNQGSIPQFQENSQHFPVLNALPLITVPNFPVNSQTLFNSQAANPVSPKKRDTPENTHILNSSPLFHVPASQIQSKFPVISKPNFPQAQQLQFQNSFASQPNTAQQQMNIPVHQGLNYGPNENFFINLNDMQQMLNSMEANIGSKKVKRSYEVYEKGTDVDHNKINRMWFNGHGHPTTTGERRYVVITNKNKDAQKENITEDVETTTQKEIVKIISLNNNKEVKGKISNNIEKDNNKIVDLK